MVANLEPQQEHMVFHNGASTAKRCECSFWEPMAYTRNALEAWRSNVADGRVRSIREAIG